MGKAALAGILMLSVSSIGFAADQIVTNDSGDLSTGSFRQVVKDAQTDDTIHFASGIGSILLEGAAENRTADSLQIIGTENRTTLDGKNASSILRLNTGETRFENLGVQNALHQTYDDIDNRDELQYWGTYTNGGAVYISGDNDTTMSVVRSQMVDNEVNVYGTLTHYLTSGRGGALFLGNNKQETPGSNMLKIDSSVWSGNRVNVHGYDKDNNSRSADASAFGGAFYSASTPTITNSVFSDNVVNAVAGISFEYYDTDADTVFQATSTARAGGGAFVAYGNGREVLIDSSTFQGNRALATGGNATGDTMRGIADASAYGGAIELVVGYSTAQIVGSQFVENEVVATAGVGNQAEQAYAFGGAAYFFAGEGTVEIIDSEFISNRATAIQTDPRGANILARGGAIDFNMFDLDSTLTLSATKGKQVVFRGNQTIESYLNEEGEREDTVRANSICFTMASRSMDPELPAPIISFNVQTEAGGLVALDDPISSNLSTVLDMNVNGQGELRWGGENVFGVNSTTTINLNSGTVTLNPDFTVTFLTNEQYVDAKYAVTMKEGLNLNLDLTGRDKTLAMFQDVSDNHDSLMFTADNVNLAAKTYSLESVKEKYLVTDYRNGVDATNFNIVDDGRFTTTVLTEGDRLYLGVDNTRAIAPIVNHRNGNVQSAYRSGEMNRVFLDSLQNVDPSLHNDLFEAVRNNSQRLTAEAIATQGIVARDWSRNFTRSLWQIRDDVGYAAKCAPTACGPCDPCNSGRAGKRNLWGGYIGSHTEQFVDNGYYGYKSNLDGVMVGIDIALNRRFEVGTYFVYGDGRTRSDALASRIESDAYQFGFYGTWKPNRKWTIRTDVSYGHFENDSERWNAFGTHRGSFDQNLFNFGLLASRDFRLGKQSKLSPYVGLRYIYLDQDSVVEKGGAAFDTGIAGANIDSLESVFGASFAFDMRRATATFHADWRHEFCDSGLWTRTGFEGGTKTFDLRSVARQRDSADLGFDLKTSWQGRQGRLWTAHAGYNANLAKRYQSQMYYASLGLKF